MGLTAITAGAAGSTGFSAATSLFTTAGLGIGGVITTVALVLTLATLAIVGNNKRYAGVREATRAAAIPLGVTFVLLVAVQTQALVAGLLG